MCVLGRKLELDNGYQTLCAGYETAVEKLKRSNERGVDTLKEDFNSIFAVEAIANKRVC